MFWQRNRLWHHRRKHRHMMLPTIRNRTEKRRSSSARTIGLSAPARWICWKTRDIPFWRLPTQRQRLPCCRKKPIDVLVTDVGLPDMSGVMLAERAKVLVPGLPVIFATGNSHVEGVTLGPNVQLVVKPFSGEALAQAIALVTRG